MDFTFKTCICAYYIYKKSIIIIIIFLPKFYCNIMSIRDVSLWANLNKIRKHNLNLKNLMSSSLFCLPRYVFLVALVFFIHKIFQPTGEAILPHVFVCFHYFLASVPDLFEPFKVFFCLTCFVRRLVKAFFAASPVSKPRFHRFPSIFLLIAIMKC